MEGLLRTRLGIPIRSVRATLQLDFNLTSTPKVGTRPRGANVGAEKAEEPLLPGVTPAVASVRQCNHDFNDYIGDSRRGLCVFHDHFVARPGGIAVFDVHSDAQIDMLDDPGPLRDWQLSVHTMAESLTAVGFVAQMDFTIAHYADTSVERLRAEEEPKKRHWWNKPEHVAPPAEEDV